MRMADSGPTPHEPLRTQRAKSNTYNDVPLKVCRDIKGEHAGDKTAGMQRIDRRIDGCWYGGILEDGPVMIRRAAE